MYPPGPLLPLHFRRNKKKVLNLHYISHPVPVEAAAIGDHDLVDRSSRQLVEKKGFGVF